MKLGRMTAGLALMAMACGATAQQAKRTHVAKAGVTRGAETPAGTVPVVMLSDLHFDPFYDPGKFERLRAAKSPGEWPAILAAPESEGREAAYQKLKTACGLRGNDSSWGLIQAALKQAHGSAPKPAFVLNSGDLMAHEFDCRFKKLAPDASGEEYSKFASYAVEAVVDAMRKEFPGTPVFPALGNNDSGCGDYRASPDDFLMRSLVASFAAVPKSDENSDLGHTDSYSAAMPGVKNGRVIVLQDIFQAATYRGCDGKPNPGAAEAELTWLRAQLESAKQKGEQVWVVAHIPPAIDVYNTISRKRDVCGKDKPVVFMSSDKLAELLEEYASTIRLAVFAHTHLDEMHVLRGPGGTVATKWVPSVSPINGNSPAYTVGYVETKTAELKDYRVFAADDVTGAKWAEEYRFSTTYKRKAYTAEEVAPLLAAMRADRQSEAADTNAYENFAIVHGGLKSLALRLVWPQYACSLENNTAEGYKACLCTAAPAAQ